MGIPHCNIFENDRCPAVVSLDKDILRGQGGYDLRLRDSTIKQAQNSYPGFSQSVATNPKRYITVSNPKQGMFLDLKEADMQKVLQEMGVKGTIKNAHDTGDGYVVLECEQAGQVLVSMAAHVPAHALVAAARVQASSSHACANPAAGQGCMFS